MEQSHRSSVWSPEYEDQNDSRVTEEGSSDEPSLAHRFLLPEDCCRVRELVRLLKARYGITAAKAAEKIGVSVDLWEKWQNPKSRLTDKSVQRMASVFIDLDPGRDPEIDELQWICSPMLAAGIEKIAAALQEDPTLPSLAFFLSQHLLQENRFSPKRAAEFSESLLRGLRDPRAIKLMEQIGAAEPPDRKKPSRPTSRARRR